MRSIGTSRSKKGTTTQLQSRVPWVTTSLYPAASDRRGVHTSYALLGNRGALGGRRSGNRLGIVSVGSAPALAASKVKGRGSVEDDPGQIRSTRVLALGEWTRASEFAVPFAPVDTPGARP